MSTGLQAAIGIPPPLALECSENVVSTLTSLIDGGRSGCFSAASSDWAHWGFEFGRRRDVVVLLRLLRIYSCLHAGASES
jgi:hypothetical protein